MNPETYAVINIGIAVLIAVLSIPLILRKVPMNHAYGIRFPQSFKSKEAWHEINEYGGKVFLISALPVLLSGIYGLTQKPQNYSLIGTVVLMMSVITAYLISYRKARQINQNKNPQQQLSGSEK
ncbi:MAG: SdpI family protein [Luteolibacter sp.]